MSKVPFSHSNLSAVRCAFRAAPVESGTVGYDCGRVGAPACFLRGHRAGRWWARRQQSRPVACRVEQLWHRCRSCRRRHDKRRIRGRGSQSDSDAHRPNRRRFARPHGAGHRTVATHEKPSPNQRADAAAVPLAAGRSGLPDDQIPPLAKPTLVHRTPPRIRCSPDIGPIRSAWSSRGIPWMLYRTGELPLCD
jgi:hypothetical protein